jgi:hypothetical protein
LFHLQIKNMVLGAIAKKINTTFVGIDITLIF